MATCEFTSVSNENNSPIMVTKLEDISRNSFILAAGRSERNLIWLPKVNSTNDFVKKVLMVLRMNDQKVLGYLWQKDGIVRVSKTGYDQTAPPLEGRNTEKITLTVQESGELRGD